MVTIEVGLGARSYPIHIGAGLLDRTDILAAAIPGRDVLVVTNTVVAPLYLERVCNTLSGYKVRQLVLPDGEAHKTLETAGRILDALVQGGYARDATVLALGGGVVGDMAGFAAACYQRGIAFLQTPTTLLAQVDSAVGGKTAVNHPQGKNLIGAFHQPIAVIADTDTLNTLPDRELRAGLAEVIKYGAILDAPFLDWLQENMSALLAREPQALAQAIRRCCELKARVVELDEKEHGCRAILNLGHTFAHAIETLSGYGQWLHGEAVAAGMVMAAEFSVATGLLDSAAARRLREIIQQAGLPVSPPVLLPAAFMQAMSHDKKVLAGRLRLVLLRNLGEAAVTDDYPSEELARFVASTLQEVNH
ncbi:MAG: 3-dehydroquinate synthase [Gammaproteobacteria bacterium]|nr:3-dehydroquinate synthase [Gammaproteobacteria bacterium]